MNNVTKSLLVEYYGCGRYENAENDSLAVAVAVADDDDDDSLQIRLETKKNYENQKDVCKKNDGSIEEKVIDERTDRRSFETENGARMIIEQGTNTNECSNDFYERNSTRNDLVFERASTGSTIERIEAKTSNDYDVDESNNVAENRDTDTNSTTMPTKEFTPDDQSNISVPTTDKKKRSNCSKAVSLPPLPTNIFSNNERFLDLRSSGLSTFPVDTIGNLSNLKFIYLEKNDLTELPDELFLRCKLLRWLDVRDNKLVTLPSSIGAHPNLETILLQRNNIRILPLELGQSANLKRLQLGGNPLVYPSMDIVARGFNAVMYALRNEWEKFHRNRVKTIESFVDDDTREGDNERSRRTPPVEGNTRSGEVANVLSYNQYYRTSERRPVVEIKRKIEDEYRGASSNSTSDRPTIERKTGDNEKSLDRLPANDRFTKYRSGIENGTTTIISEKTRRRREEREKREITFRRALVREERERRELVLKKWREDERRLIKMIKTNKKRRTDENPFSFDAVDDTKIHLVPRRNNVNERISQIFDSLSRFRITGESTTISPEIERVSLSADIEKITNWQNEIRKLKLQNETTNDGRVLKTSDTTPVRLARPPSIII